MSVAELYESMMTSTYVGDDRVKELWAECKSRILGNPQGGLVVWHTEDPAEIVRVAKCFAGFAGKTYAARDASGMPPDGIEVVLERHRKMWDGAPFQIGTLRVSREYYRDWRNEILKDLYPYTFRICLPSTRAHPDTGKMWAPHGSYGYDGHSWQLPDDLRRLVEGLFKANTEACRAHATGWEAAHCDHAGPHCPGWEVVQQVIANPDAFKHFA